MTFIETEGIRMKFIALCSMALLFCFTMSCGTKFGDDQSSKSQNGEIESKYLDSWTRIETQPSADPEKYLVYIGWPKIEADKNIRIRLDKTLVVVDSSQTTFSHEVNHDQVLTYVFDVLDLTNKVEKTFSKQIKIPKDFVVRSGHFEFTENQRISVHRLFLNPDVALRTNGFEIEIVTDQLISKSGKMETFPEGGKAPNDQSGRPSGSLTIKARLAAGDLKISMRGENGGDGSKGPGHTTRAASGIDAGYGQEVCTGGGWDFLADKINKTKPLERCSCSSDGNPGSQGQTGAKGLKGLPAQNGGDVQSLKISIEDGSEFDLQTEMLPGLAGNPGTGGDGQIGGAGGAGSSNGDLCQGKPGPEGPVGPVGDPGNIASNGKSGLICVYIASTGRNDCHE